MQLLMTHSPWSWRWMSPGLARQTLRTKKGRAGVARIAPRARWLSYVQLLSRQRAKQAAG